MTAQPHLRTRLTFRCARYETYTRAMIGITASEAFQPNAPAVEPRDDWERKLFGAALDCGVSVPDSAVSSDGLYE